MQLRQPLSRQDEPNPTARLIQNRGAPTHCYRATIWLCSAKRRLFYLCLYTNNFSRQPRSQETSDSLCAILA